MIYSMCCLQSCSQDLNISDKEMVGRCIIKFMIRLVFLLVAVALCSDPNAANRVLVLSDNPAVYVSHSTFFDQLKQLGFKADFKNLLSVTFNLQIYGEWQYDHLIIFASSTNEVKVPEQELLDFYDSGHNILLLGQAHQSRFFRKLMNSFGLDMHEFGTLATDYFNNHQGNYHQVTTHHVNIVSASKPVAYSGSGLSMTPYETNQVYGFVRGSETAFSGTILSQNVIYVGATQGRNNARFVATGGWEIFSNAFLEDQKLGNQELSLNILKWNFQQSRVLKAENLVHRRVGSNDLKPYNYRLNEDVHFSIDIYEWNGQNWIPYNSDGQDVYLEFVMLDPYYRIPLKKGKGAKYEVEFKIPDKYGVFQFKVTYLKPGYTFLRIAEKITVRPFRHDEYPRYLVQALPYYFGSFGTMAGFLVFLFAFLLNK